MHKNNQHLGFQHLFFVYTIKVRLRNQAVNPALVITAA